MTLLLSVRDLKIRYSVRGALAAALTGESAHIEAVSGVSFDLVPGETLALVGESGSGKTSVARTIAGLIKPYSGSVHFEGRELIGCPPTKLKEIRRQMAIIFQDPVGSLSPRLRVSSILAEPFRVHGLASSAMPRQIDRLLDLVGLPKEIAGRYPHQLSGGQARRINVARAIALEPKLLIADEPTAGLDVSVQGEILNLLNELRERLGISMLIITHNLHVVRHIAGRMAIMYLGRIVESGPTARLFAAPCHPYTAALLSASPRPDPDVKPQRLEISGEIPSLFRRPSGCEFHTRCPFVREKCRFEPPTLTVAGPGIFFTCHFPLTSPRAASGQGSSI
ncbi:MAG TPA: ABC transporter ATP-binding protein [Aestuariivirgaceae bacterium]|jgi:peptide/nickel transport system ATP-binding protein